MGLEISRCCYINRLPIEWRGQRIGAPSVGQCDKDTLPGMTYCAEHAGKEAMAYWIKILAEKVIELGGALC